jgi:hypothetical protein
LITLDGVTRGGFRFPIAQPLVQWGHEGPCSP